MNSRRTSVTVHVIRFSFTWTLARLQLMRGFDELLCPRRVDQVLSICRIRLKLSVRLCGDFADGFCWRMKSEWARRLKPACCCESICFAGLVKSVLILVPNPLVSQWARRAGGQVSSGFSSCLRERRMAVVRSSMRNMIECSSRHPLPEPEAVPRPLRQLTGISSFVDEAHHCRTEQQNSGSSSIRCNVAICFCHSPRRYKTTCWNCLAC